MDDIPKEKKAAAQNPQKIKVAAAVMIRSDGCVLTQRRPEGPLAGFWEFPGGKIRPAESPAAALRRELREELGIVRCHSHPWILRNHRYPHAAVALYFRRVFQWGDEPHPREGQKIAWRDPSHRPPNPLLPANESLWRLLNLPTICGISAAEKYGEEDFLRRLKIALGGGLRLLQIRDKTLTPPARKKFARRAAKIARQFRAMIFVNDDENLAREICADGIHLSSAKLLACRSRPNFSWVAASCHNLRELRKAESIGADFVFLSPIRSDEKPHPSRQSEDDGKRNLCGRLRGGDSLGWAEFSRLAKDCPMPIFALGGMNSADILDAQKRGGHGVAMIRGCWEF